MSSVLNEIQTIYVVIYEGDKELKYKNREIMAWSSDKNKIKFYLEFHKSKKLTLKKVTDNRRNLLELINSNINSEVYVHPLIIENDGKEKVIYAPVTELEITDLNEFIGSMGEGFIDYRIIYSKFPKLKDKYQKALAKLFLIDVIKYVMFSETNSLVESISLNQVKLLFKFHPNLFFD